MRVNRILNFRVLALLALSIISQNVFATENLDKLLLEAVLEENATKVKTLLEQGANPNSTEVLFKKRTIMGWASQHKTTKLLEILITNGGDVNLLNTKDSWSPFPIYNALMADRLQNFKLLLEHGANPNIVDNHQRIPFMAAVASGDWEFAFLLLQAGTNLEFENKWGETPKDSLERAGMSEDSEWRKKVFIYFAKKGINLNPRMPLPNN